MYRVIIFIALGSFLLATSPVFAQHEYPQVEVQRGGQYFRGNCAACHGQNGDLIEDVSLADPLYLRDVTDEQMIAIIITGIPGTAMLANDYNELQAGNIVAYLRDMSEEGRIAPVNGDPGRGQVLLESSDCLDCHRIKRKGSRLAPDLSVIGLIRRTSELEEALLDPNATILPEHRNIRIVTENGREITGRLLNHDQVTVQLLDSDERLQSFMKADLREFDFVLNSNMQSYAEQFSGQEIEDILSYLVSLNGGEVQ